MNKKKTHLNSIHFIHSDFDFISSFLWKNLSRDGKIFFFLLKFRSDVPQFLKRFPRFSLVNQPVTGGAIDASGAAGGDVSGDARPAVY